MEFAMFVENKDLARKYSKMESEVQNRIPTLGKSVNTTHISYILCLP